MAGCDRTTLALGGRPAHSQLEETGRSTSAVFPGNSGNARCYSAFIPLLFDNRESGHKRLKASHKSNPKIQHNSGKKL
jgi:hypothetical protein